MAEAPVFRSEPPHRIGRFEVLQRLGKGGMSEVYLAMDPLLERAVAIKVLPLGRRADRSLRQRFIREARVVAGLHHPNLITIYDMGEDKGRLYLVMEHLQGQDLASFLVRRSLTASEILEVLAQVCDGLARAHARGIVHRDVNPSNIRLWREDGRILVKLMDFGLARVPNSDLTLGGEVVGTVAYIAPEYPKTGKADPRVDLYALGVVLHEALTGRHPPHEASAPTGIHVLDAPRPAVARGPVPPDVSPAVWEVVERALMRDPDARFRTAADLARALRAARDPRWPGLAQ